MAGACEQTQPNTSETTSDLTRAGDGISGCSSQRGCLVQEEGERAESSLCCLLCAHPVPSTEGHGLGARRCPRRWGPEEATP